MLSIVLVYIPTLEKWLTLGGGVFIILLIAFLVTKYTKYGEGSNYGIIGEFKDNFDEIN